MATRVKHTIGEIDVVAFTEAIDKTDYSDATGAWPPGTEGTVVSDYGDMLDLISVTEDRLKLIEKHS